jgi:predicted ATPase
VNYRPEYQHSWGGKTYYTQLWLDPLPSESADLLLQALLGNDGSLAPLKQLLIERTEGNLFFLEESARTLVEPRMLVGEHGAYCLVHPLRSIQVPAMVQAVLAARIVQAIETLYPDRLAEQVERLAHHALRGEVWDKAVRCRRQAGAKASARPAYREAVVCLEQVLVALSHLSESRETLEQAIDLRFRPA